MSDLDDIDPEVLARIEAEAEGFSREFWRKREQAAWEAFAVAIAAELSGRYGDSTADVAATRADAMLVEWCKRWGREADEAWRAST